MKNSLPADTYLLSQMQADDEQALLKLMKKYDRALFRYVDARIQSAENAQEAVQDIFITLWNNRFSVSIIDSLSPYLYKAAKNKVVDYYIAADREIVNYEALLPEYNNEVAPAADTGIMTAELQEWLSTEVDKMPDTVKSVFRLSRQEHLPVKDIARQLSLSEQTVKNNLTIAIKRLRMRFTGMEGASVVLLLIKALFSK